MTWPFPEREHWAALQLRQREHQPEHPDSAHPQDSRRPTNSPKRCTEFGHAGERLGDRLAVI